MKHRKKSSGDIQRREFFRQSACAALGVTGLVNMLANLRLMGVAMAQNPGSEYKAIVCLFLNGGNDSTNMLVPKSGQLRIDYDLHRGILAVPASSLHEVFPDNETREFGLHPQCDELAALFNAGDLAFVNNVGTLSYPIETREEYLQGLVPVPPQLFSHSDQQVQWQSSVPDKPFTSGWGGRIADLLHATVNPGSDVSMSISLNGKNNFQVGLNPTSNQYILSPTGVTNLKGYGTDYLNALNPDDTYKDNDPGWRFRAFRETMRLVHTNLQEDAFSDTVTTALDTEGVVGAALTAAAQVEANLGFTFDDIFTNNNANTDLGDQLKMVARLIAGRDPLGNTTQIYFVQVTGYDTHQQQLTAHDLLLDELNHGIKAFWDSLVTLGDQNRVLTFTASDFNRTLTPNGQDPDDGADHAWGGHQMVLGGMVKGKKFYGHYPDLAVGEGLDVDNERGRWIPTTAVDQYSAVLAKWIGVDSNSMEAIFPNLPRFDDPFTSSEANLNFIDFMV